MRVMAEVRPLLERKHVKFDQSFVDELNGFMNVLEMPEVQRRVSAEVRPFVLKVVAAEAIANVLSGGTADDEAVKIAIQELKEDCTTMPPPCERSVGPNIVHNRAHFEHRLRQYHVVP